MVVRRAGLLLLVAVALFAARAEAVCQALTQPPFECSKTDPFSQRCACLTPVTDTFDPADPLAVASAGCPACPSSVPVCTDLAPSHPSLVKICYRGKLREINKLVTKAYMRVGAFLPTPATCCGCNKALCAQRQETLVKYATARNVFVGIDLTDPVALATAYQSFNKTLFSIFAPEATMVVDGIGTFGPRLFAVEYMLITTPAGGGGQINVAYAQPYNIRTRDQGRVVKTTDCTRIQLNVPNFFQSWISTYDTRNEFTFQRNTALLQTIHAIPACILQNPSLPPSAEQIQQICGSLDAVCAAVPTYEFRNNVAGCIALWSRLALKQGLIAGGVCDYQFPGVADTSHCRQVHAISALVDPATHCPHTNTQSATCFDRPGDLPSDTCLAALAALESGEGGSPPSNRRRAEPARADGEVDSLIALFHAIRANITNDEL